MVGNLAQTILAATTIGTLFFTVIPLYQKAALDEQVAKQQDKLVKLERQVRANYERIRADAVRRYFFATGIKCTGLLDPPVRLENNNPKVDPSEPALLLDVPACMRTELILSNTANDLSPEDLATFTAAAEKTSHTIAVAQLSARARVKAVDPTKAAEGPLNFSSYATLSLSMYKKAGATEQQLRETIQLIAANGKKLAIVVEYQTSVREQLQKLVSTTWPTANAPE